MIQLKVIATIKEMRTSTSVKPIQLSTRLNSAKTFQNKEDVPMDINADLLMELSNFCILLQPKYSGKKSAMDFGRMDNAPME